MLRVKRFYVACHPGSDVLCSEEALFLLVSFKRDALIYVSVCCGLRVYVHLDLSISRVIRCAGSIYWTLCWAKNIVCMRACVFE